MLPLPSPVIPVRERRITRRVATDCFVDVDTIRYSVPHRLVRCTVEVLVADHDVVIFEGRIEVARHRRHSEPHQRVTDPRHFEDIFRQRDEAAVTASSPIGRSLADYADCVGCRMTELVRARVEERLVKLRLGAVAQRLDGILSHAAPTEPTFLDFLDQILTEETDAKQRKAWRWASRSPISRR